MEAQKGHPRAADPRLGHDRLLFPEGLLVQPELFFPVCKMEKYSCPCGAETGLSRTAPTSSWCPSAAGRGAEGQPWPRGSGRHGGRTAVQLPPSCPEVIGRAELPGVLGNTRPRWPVPDTGPRGGEGRWWPVGLGQHVPACPGQGRWPQTCPLAAGMAGHSWAHSAPVGLAAPRLAPCRAQAEWQGTLYGPLVLLSPGGPARGPPILGALSHRQTGLLVTGRVGQRLTPGSCPPGTFPGMACILTHISHVSPVTSITAAG